MEKVLTDLYKSTNTLKTLICNEVRSKKKGYKIT